jgi:hypothetical protein
MIVADFVFAVALDVAMVVTVFATRVVFRFLGLRGAWIRVCDRPRRRARRRATDRRA